MKKILVLYTSAGEGHKKIAENISALLEQDFEIDLVDLFKLEKGKLVDGGIGIYLWILNHTPWLWNFFYTNKIFLKITLPLRVPLAGFKSKKVLELLNRKHYDIVLTTHVNPSAILSFLKGKNLYRGKFVIAFSDYHLHPYWVFKNADLFLVNIKEQKQEMLRMGIAENKIIVSGVTLKSKQNFDIQELKNRYAVNGQEKVVLFLGGSLGVYITYEEIEKLRKLEIKLIVVCGKNKDLYENLKQRYETALDVLILSYVQNMEELYAIADLVVTKPGGLTIAECMRYRLPILINAYMPGQEKLNYEYLLQNNLVMPLTSDLASRISSEFETNDFVEQLRNNEIINQNLNNGSAIKKAFNVL